MILRKVFFVVSITAITNLRYFSKQSLLVPLPPPPPPIFDHTRALLAPTYKLMDVLRESFESGAQKQLAIRMWEKAWSGEPYILARNACSRMWKLWKDNDRDKDQ